MNGVRSGFTLIEVLVAVAVFSVSMVLMNLLVTNLQVNAKARDTVNVNQAGQEYLERVTNTWRNVERYGVLHSDSTSAKYVLPPTTIPGYTWEVTTCPANPASFGGCSATATVTTQPNVPNVDLSTASMVLLTVEYKKTTTGKGQPFRATMGVARP